MSIELHGMDAGGTCFDTRDATDAQGDFHLCRFADEIPAGVTATLRAGNETREVPIDAHFRLGIAYVQLAKPRDAQDVAGDRQFARTVHVAGRIFFAHPEGVVVDGIHVNATALQGLNVTIRMDVNDSLVANATVATDAQGDYAADLPMQAIPAGAQVLVEAGGRISAMAVNATMRRADVVMLHHAAVVATRPGEGTPRIPDPLWIGLAAGLLSAVSWRRRSRG
jgi:hypothetical protein